eukprot:14645980-Alexandrium_andersonii.AAC.1
MAPSEVLVPERAELAPRCLLGGGRVCCSRPGGPSGAPCMASGGASCSVAEWSAGDAPTLRYPE